MIEYLETEHGTFTNNETTGQTAEEVYAEYLKQIDICPSKTVEERLAEAEQENKLLKAQVSTLTDLSDFHEELIVELASVVYA